MVRIRITSAKKIAVGTMVTITVREAVFSFPAKHAMFKIEITEAETGNRETSEIISV